MELGVGLKEGAKGGGGGELGELEELKVALEGFVIKKREGDRSYWRFDTE